MFFNSHEIYLNLDREDEIRLLILEPGTKLDPIYCHLKHSNLSEDPVYEAVSYMWGAQEPPSYPINISGYTEYVLENLNDTLIQLRRPHGTRVLWIDALCINQDDKQERNQQVAQMGMIYSKAANVCISLGRKGSRAGTLRPKHAEETFDFITKVSAFVNVKHSNLVDLVHSIEELIWVMNFFSLQYWKRLWIIQEVVLAAKLEIYWVESVIPWETLQDFLQVVRSCKASPLNNAPAEIDTVIHSGLTNPVPYRLYLQRQLAEESSTARQTPILSLVKTYADAECAEARDRVFALRSFASECCRIAVPVDYACTTYHLCNKLARHHLQSHLNFPDRSPNLEDIVCHLNYIRRLIGEGSARERPKEGYPHFFNPKQYLAIFTDPHDGEKNAARGQLTVRGYLATTIRETTRPLRSIQVRKEKDNVDPYADRFYIQDRPLMSCLHTNPEDSMTNGQLPKEVQNVLKLLAHEALFSIESITWENYPQARNGNSNYNEFPRIGGHLPIDGLEDYLGQPASLANFILLMIECFQSHPGHNDCVLFLADHDTVGIAPPATRPGDKILIFNDKRTKPKHDGIDKLKTDVLAVVRSVNGKHEILGRARSFAFPSDFFTSANQKDGVEFEIDVPGMLLLSRATYIVPFLMMSEAWRDERRNRTEFNALKRMMKANSSLSEERVECDGGGNHDLATRDGEYAGENEIVGKHAAQGYASGDDVVENDIEAVDTNFLGLSLRRFVRRKWSRFKARLKD